mmetsp:Transcript_17268/g.56456  ORF Transcript_17268/g.56456 Transcript_17268/m.56456 type:complete len:264 (-) Transcript_17268:65-856(-)
MARQLGLLMRAHSRSFPGFGLAVVCPLKLGRLGALVGHRLCVEHHELERLVDEGLGEEHEEVEEVVVGRRDHLVQVRAAAQHLEAGPTPALEAAGDVVGAVEVAAGAVDAIDAGGARLGPRVLGVFVDGPRDAAKEVLEGQDVVEEADGPDDVNTAEDEPAEEGGGKPDVGVVEHAHDGVGAEGEELAHAFPHPHVGGVEQEGVDESFPREAANGEERHADAKGHEEHHGHLHDHVGEEVGHRRGHAVADLALDRIVYSMLPA